MSDVVEFKEKARRQVFNTPLRDFPVVFEMYARSIGFEVDRNEAMTRIIEIVRTSENADVAYTMVCHYLDGLEGVG